MTSIPTSAEHVSDSRAINGNALNGNSSNGTDAENVDALPPFPDGLPEAQIETISLGKLLANDTEERARLVAACRDPGFFYMDLTDSDTGRELYSKAEELLSLSKQAFALPDEAKQAVAADKMRSLFGYKRPGMINQTDELQRKDVGEFWSIAKDDIAAAESSIPYPPVITDAIPTTLRPFSIAAHTLGLEVIRTLASHFSIPPATLLDRHRFSAPSGDHVRLTYGPGSGGSTSNTTTIPALPTTEATTRITTYAHTDFGSVTVLFNWLGGLQIANRAGHDAWEWVRPRAGAAIINMGDAMVAFTGGRLASGKHRVVGAPGAQALPPRYSVVYFVRPEDAVVLEDLTVAEGQRRRRREEDGGEAVTAAEWIDRKLRVMGQTPRAM